MYSIDMQFVENISVVDFIHVRNLVRKHKRKNKPAAVQNVTTKLIIECHKSSMRKCAYREDF